MEWAFWGLCQMPSVFDSPFWPVGTCTTPSLGWALGQVYLRSCLTHVSSQVCRVSLDSAKGSRRPPFRYVELSVLLFLSPLLFPLRYSAPPPSRTFLFTPCAQEGGRALRGPSLPALGSGECLRAESQGDHRTHPSQGSPRSLPFRPRSQSCAAYSPVSESPCFMYFVQISGCLQWELTIPFEIPSRVVHIHDADWMYAQETCTKLDLGLIKDSEKAVGSFWSAS